MRYCDAACRASAFRTRTKARGTPMNGPDDPMSSLSGSSRSRPYTETDTDSRVGKERLRRAARRGRKYVPPSSPVQDTAGPTSNKRSRRIPFNQQVLSEAPAGAVAYRLVLPLRSHAALPKIAPAPDAGGHLLAYRLNPFELPSDIRLRDGHVYRILWVGSHGEPIPPRGESHLPALSFFLGPADASSSETDDEYESVLRDVSDPDVRRQCEVEVARQRLTKLQHYQDDVARERDLALRAAELRFRDAQEAANRERVRVQREEDARLAEQQQAQQRERQKQQMAAQTNAEIKTLITTVAFLLGVPAVGTAIAAFKRKLDGAPMDWSEAKETMAEILRALATNVAKLQENAKPAPSLTEKS